MDKKLWSFYAPVYELAMSIDYSDRLMYKYLYKSVAAAAKSKRVLEIATGPGMLAKHIAHAAKSVTATDYSEGMIAQAKKGECPPNLVFEVADATSLPYENGSFDVVVMANALHLLPQPEKALAEIDRVLAPDGVFIAPNFVEHKGGALSRAWSGLLELAGIRFAHQWSAEEYRAFLEANGWRVTKYKLLPSRIPLAYAECYRK